MIDSTKNKWLSADEIKDFILPSVFQLNRLEIIDTTKPLEDGGGRTVIVSPEENKHVSIHIQDEGRTLKVFIET